MNINELMIERACVCLETSILIMRASTAVSVYAPVVLMAGYTFVQLFNSYDSQIGDSIREYYLLRQWGFFHKSTSVVTH